MKSFACAADTDILFIWQQSHEFGYIFPILLNTYKWQPHSQWYSWEGNLRRHAGSPHNVLISTSLCYLIIYVAQFL